MTAIDLRLAPDQELLQRVQASTASTALGRSGGAATDGDRFRADITEVVHTRLNEAATLLVIEWWTPADGLQLIERE